MVTCDCSWCRTFGLIIERRERVQIDGNHIEIVTEEANV